MEDVVIIVPIYKATLDITEKVSLRQLFRVLGKYHICFILPPDVRCEYEELKNQKYDIKYYSAHFFLDAKCYSKLLLSEEFYKDFSAFEYMLIYQLDAFVFSDRLMEFVRMGYDYIGAETPLVYWPYNRCRVGNGGFSLRRVDAMLRLLARKNEIIALINERIPQEDRQAFFDTEDEFISYGATELPDFVFKFAGYATAREFSIEYNIDGIYRDLSIHVPFGCHRWHRYNFEKWWKIISLSGYEMDDIDYQRLSSYKHNYEKWVVSVYIENYMDQSAINAISELIETDVVSLWGGGKMLSTYHKRLKNLKKQIGCVYDKVAGDNRDSIYIYPTKSTIMSDKHIIIVSTEKYEEDVCRELEEMGRKRGLDYFTWTDLAECLVNALEINVYGETEKIRKGIADD